MVDHHPVRRLMARVPMIGSFLPIGPAQLVLASFSPRHRRMSPATRAGRPRQVQENRMTSGDDGAPMAGRRGEDDWGEGSDCTSLT